MLISDTYRDLQREMHKNEGYGVASVHYWKLALQCIDSVGAKEILDYGCGKGRLTECIRAAGRTDLVIYNYDPAVPKWATPPAPREFVVCLDVMEHIEPDCLDAVMDDLQRVTLKYALCTVATRPAQKILPDGRNAHLIQQPYAWWLPRFEKRFQLRTMQETQGEFFIFLGALNNAPEL